MEMPEGEPTDSETEQDYIREEVHLQEDGKCLDGMEEEIETEVLKEEQKFSPHKATQPEPLTSSTDTSQLEVTLHQLLWPLLGPSNLTTASPPGDSICHQ